MHGGDEELTLEEKEGDDDDGDGWSGRCRLEQNRRVLLSGMSKRAVSAFNGESTELLGECPALLSMPPAPLIRNPLWVMC